MGPNLLTKVIRLIFVIMLVSYFSNQGSYVKNDGARLSATITDYSENLLLSKVWKHPGALVNLFKGFIFVDTWMDPGHFSL